MVHCIIVHFTYPDLPFVKRYCYAWAMHLESMEAKRLKILHSGLCLRASRLCASVCMLPSNWFLWWSEWAGNVRYPRVFTGCRCSKSNIISGLLVSDPMGPVLSDIFVKNDTWLKLCVFPRWWSRQIQATWTYFWVLINLLPNSVCLCQNESYTCNRTLFLLGLWNGMFSMLKKGTNFHNLCEKRTSDPLESRWSTCTSHWRNRLHLSVI